MHFLQGIGHSLPRSFAPRAAKILKSRFNSTLKPATWHACWLKFLKTTFELFAPQLNFRIRDPGNVVIPVLSTLSKLGIADGERVVEMVGCPAPLQPRRGMK